MSKYIWSKNFRFHQIPIRKRWGMLHTKFHWQRGKASDLSNVKLLQGSSFMSYLDDHKYGDGAEKDAGKDGDDKKSVSDTSITCVFSI